MEKKFTLEEKIQQTMSSLDQVQPAETDPYFYTRLKARMGREAESASPGWLSILKPSVVLPIFLLFITLEAYYLTNQNNSEYTAEQTSDYFTSYYAEDLPSFELQ